MIDFSGDAAAGARLLAALPAEYEGQLIKSYIGATYQARLPEMWGTWSAAARLIRR